jgi:hypothetical protein
VKAIDSAVNKLITYIIAGLMGASAYGYAIGKMVAAHKWKVAMFVVGVPSAVFFVLFIFIARVNQILQNPLLLLTTITAADIEYVPDYEGMPVELEGYIEPGFFDSGIPNNSPFGQPGTTWTYITAGFNDPSYAINFGHSHGAIDIIPNSEYYMNNQAYNKFKDVVMFATCSGNAKSLVDGNGANYIYLVCEGEQYSLIFLHNKKNFIQKGEAVHVIAGQPIAVMGSTGFSTGPHIHYQVRNYKTGQLLNPFDFMNMTIFNLYHYYNGGSDL